MDRQKSKPSGFSLIELVLVVGMMGFLITAFASFAAHMARDLRAANQKIEQMTMGQDIQMALRRDTGACDLMVRDRTFNSGQITANSGPRIDLPGGIVISSATGETIAQPGELLRGTVSGLRVLTTELEITRQIDQDIFEGVFRVTLDPDSLVRSLQPVSAVYFFEAQPGAGVRTLVGCSPQPVGEPCEDGEVQFGVLQNGETLCRPLAQMLDEMDMDSFIGDFSCPEGEALVGFDSGSPLCQAVGSDGGGGCTTFSSTQRGGQDYSAQCPEGTRRITCLRNVNEGDGIWRCWEVLCERCN